MGQITNYLEKAILNHILKVAPYTRPSNIYLGLSTANPTSDGTGWADPTYTPYARVLNAFGSANARSIIQSSQDTFATVTSGTSTIKYYGLWDQSSGGNLLAYGALSADKTIVAGNTPVVSPSQINVSFNAGVFFTGACTSILDWVFRPASTPPAWLASQPTHLNIGVSTTLPHDDGTNINEPSPAGDVGYARKQFDTWNTASGDPASCTNNGSIIMATAIGSWGLLVATMLYADTTAVYYASISPNQTIGAGDTLRWLNNGDYLIGLQ